MRTEEDFFLEILQDIETVIEKIDACSDKLDALGLELEDDDYARLGIWSAVLKTIVKNAEEEDMVDTLNLHPLVLSDKDGEK